MYPARIAVTGDLHADERMVRMLVDAVITVTHNGSVDVPGDNEDQRLGRPLERSFDLSGV